MRTWPYYKRVLCQGWRKGNHCSDNKPKLMFLALLFLLTKSMKHTRLAKYRKCFLFSPNTVVDKAVAEPFMKHFFFYDSQILIGNKNGVKMQGNSTILFLISCRLSLEKQNSLA